MFYSYYFFDNKVLTTFPARIIMLLSITRHALISGQTLNCAGLFSKTL